MAASEPEPMYAPYARAAALVASDGTRRAQKNVVDVRRYETGRYRLTVPETIDVTHAALHVTPHAGADWGTEVYVRPVSGQPHVVDVLTSKNGTPTNEPFYFSIM